MLTIDFRASVANFIRLAALVKLKASTDPLCESLYPYPTHQLLTKDFTVDAAPVFVWSSVEVSIGISVAGILELGPLMRKWNVKGFEDYAYFAELSDNGSDSIKMKDMKYKIERV